MYRCACGLWQRKARASLFLSLNTADFWEYSLTWQSKKLAARSLDRFSKNTPWPPGRRLVASQVRFWGQEWLKRLIQSNGRSLWFTHSVSVFSHFVFYDGVITVPCGNPVSLLLWCTFPIAARARPYGYDSPIPSLFQPLPPSDCRAGRIILKELSEGLLMDQNCKWLKKKILIWTLTDSETKHRSQIQIMFFFITF